MRRLGAGHVIDHTTQDATTGAARYDLAFQLGGTYSPGAEDERLCPAKPVLASHRPAGPRRYA